MTPFGTLENVKGRYKSPGAEGTQREQWMGQSWGLVTFVTLAAAEAARERGIAVPTSPPSKDAQGIPATTGYLVVKMIDRRLAEQSPVGRQQAEQNVIRMEAALRRYTQYVRQTTSLGTAATATASPSSIVVARTHDSVLHSRPCFCCCVRCTRRSPVTACCARHQSESSFVTGCGCGCGCVCPCCA